MGEVLEGERHGWLILMILYLKRVSVNSRTYHLGGTSVDRLH